MFIEINLEEIKNLLSDKKKQNSRMGASIESILSNFDWRSFESAVAQIFSANGFSIIKNVRFKTHRKYEIDLVAYNRRVAYNCVDVFCVDCKRWGSGRYKKSALLKAADEQYKRTREFEKFIDFEKFIPSFDFNGSYNSSADNYRSCHSNLEALVNGHKLIFYPTIVTLHDELVQGECHGVIIIPIQKLNSFLNSTEEGL